LLAVVCDYHIRLFALRPSFARIALDAKTDRASPLAFNAAGTTLAATCDRVVKVWSTADGSEMLSHNAHSRLVMSLAFSPEGDSLASGSADGQVRVWSLQSRTERHVWDLHQDAVSGLAFSADGRFLASGGADGRVGAFSVSDGRPVFTVEAESAVQSIALHPDGKRLAAGLASGEIKVWSLASGRRLMTLAAHGDRVVWLGFSPDGQRLVSGGRDGDVRSWSVPAGLRRAALSGFSSELTGLSTVPDPFLVAASSATDPLTVWSLVSGEKLFSAAAGGPGTDVVVFAPSGTTLAATVDRAIVLLSLPEGTEIRRLTGHGGRVICLAFHPDGSKLVAGTEEEVRIWELGPEPKYVDVPLRSAARKTAFGPEGKCVAVGAADGTITLYDATTGKAMRVLTHAWGGHTLRFTGDTAAIAADSADGSVKVWSVASGQEQGVFSGHRMQPVSLDFTPDNRLMASVDEGGKVLFWDVARRTVLPVEAAIGIIDGSRVLFDRAGRTLFVACKDGRIEILQSTFPASAVRQTRMPDDLEVVPVEAPAEQRSFP